MHAYYVATVSAFSIPQESSQRTSLPTTPALHTQVIKSTHKQSSTPSHGTRSGAKAAKTALSNKAGGVVEERGVAGDGRGEETGLAITGGKVEVARDPTR